jgi:uncharacterized membrane protein
MSQEEVLRILKELGGEATTKEIRDLAKKKFPTSTLYSYVTNRLRKLEKWGYVKQDKTKDKWIIIKNK